METSTLEQDYTIIGREDVEDENNEHVCYKPCRPVTINASSLDEAVQRGEQRLQQQIDSYRREREDLSKGVFTARVDRVLDSNGNVLHEA